MTITNISIFRNKLSNIIKIVVEHNDSITVTTKNSNVVIVSEAEYNAMLETIYLNSQKGLVDKIKEGEKEDISKMPSYNSKE